MRRSLATRLALVAVLLAAALPACDRPEDSAWLKITSFRDSSTGGNIAVLISDPEVEEPDLVDIGVTSFANADGPFKGAGVLLDRLEISYSYGGVAFSSYSYGISLYLPSSAGTGGSAEEVFLEGIPVVTLAIKEQVEDLGGGSVTLQAHFLLHGETDDGQDIEVEGRLPVNFETAPAPGATETISQPGRPFPSTASGVVDESLTFSTSGAASSLNHALHYRFDWGDGTFSDWSESKAANHSWDTAQQFQVTVQARCSLHRNVLSSPSEPATVSITSAP